MERTAKPRSHRALPEWPSGRRSSSSKHVYTSSAGAGVTASPVSDQLQDKTRSSPRSQSAAAGFIQHEDVLPGIPSRHWSPAPPSPVKASSKSRHKSIELSRPSTRRAMSSEGTSLLSGPSYVIPRVRTRTMTVNEVKLHSALFHPAEQAQRVAATMRDTVKSANGDRAFENGHSGVTSSAPASRNPSGGAWEVSQSNSKTLRDILHSDPDSFDKHKTSRIARASKMRHLMDASRGRMEGDIWYRLPQSSTWSSSYCAINVLSGSLLKEAVPGHVDDGILVADLRGCRVRHYARDDTATFLQLQLTGSPFNLHLTPKDPEDSSLWHAALLCWQVVASHQNLATGSDVLRLVPLDAAAALEPMVRETPSQSRRSVPIIKTGKMGMLAQEQSVQYSEGEGDRDSKVKRWTIVSCIIKRDGTLDIYTADDTALTSRLALSRLSRSAVQRLHTSVYGPNCIAIYPLESRSSTNSLHLRPVVLKGDSRVSFEAWYTLLRAFTIPELYGPPRSPSVDILRSNETLPGLSAGRLPSVFRVEQTLELQISNFIDKRAESSLSSEDTDGSQCPTTPTNDYHVEVLIDGIVRAKTRRISVEREVAWYENFQIPDVPATASCVMLRLVQTGPKSQKRTHPKSKAASQQQQGQQRTNRYGSQGRVVGDSTISLSTLCGSKSPVTKLSIYDEHRAFVGTMTVKPRLEQDIVLTDDEYSLLSDLLHSLSNSLTFEIAERTSSELSKFAMALLNIFQVSGQASDWLASLAEEEIDGLRKEKPPSQFILRRGVVDTDNGEPLPAYDLPGDRQAVVRVFSRHAAAEANLLFRGNTLISKALDLHMQRLGKEYLEDTLGKKVREIIERDFDLEVDPAQIAKVQSIPYNMHQLHNACEEVWALIYKSAPACPPELQSIFRHIRACAQDRFGDFLRNAPYTAVSGFVFLRFFCPALLNPSLFGLTRSPLGARNQRSFMLIAKCIQGLANQTTFGAKQPWMEPMNTFLQAHRQEFRDFIDSICSASAPSPVPASYSAPVQMLTRLPPLAREGYPSLPFLIDSSRSFAALARLWLDNHNYSPSGDKTDYDLLQFHNECHRIRQLSKDRFDRAERTTTPSADFSGAWEEMAKRMETHSSEFWEQDSTTITCTENGPDAKAVPSREGLKWQSRARRPSQSAVSSRPSTSPARAEDDRGTRGFGRLRFRSRSGSRPGSSRLAPAEERREPGESGEQEEDTARASSAFGWEIERPATAEPMKRKLFRRRKSDKDAQGF